MEKQIHCPLRLFSFLHTQDTWFATLANSLADFSSQKEFPLGGSERGTLRRGAALPGLSSLSSVQSLFCPLMVAESSLTVWNNSWHFWGFSFTLKGAAWQDPLRNASAAQRWYHTPGSVAASTWLSTTAAAFCKDWYQCSLLLQWVWIQYFSFSEFPSTDIRFKIQFRNQCCRNATIISEYWENKNLKNQFMTHTALSLCQK